VIWSSGIATLASALGIAIGMWMSLPRRRIPYRGQKRWHTIVGLIFGPAAVTWAFSGMLSMDPFPSAAARPRDLQLRGSVAPSAFAANPPRAVVEAIGDARVKQLELITVADEPLYLATLDDLTTRVVSADGDVRREVDRDRLRTAIASAARGAVTMRVLDSYDRYYLDRRGGKPLPVVVAELEDADRTRFYIDPKTAAIVGSYNTHAWVTRWLYHGLHSLDFPLLYTHRPAWDLIVIALLLGGAALSVTAVVLASRVVMRRGWTEGSRTPTQATRS